MSLLALLKTFRTEALLGPDKLVMLALADGSDEFGFSSLSHATLCLLSGLSTTGVRNALGRLARDGWISRAAAHDSTHSTPVTYRLALDRLAPAEGRPPSVSGRQTPLSLEDTPSVSEKQTPLLPETEPSVSPRQTPHLKPAVSAEPIALPFLETGVVLGTASSLKAGLELETEQEPGNSRPRVGGKGSGERAKPGDSHSVRPAAVRIGWLAAQQRFTGVEESDVAAWEALAPAVAVEREVASATRWLVDHPTDAKQKRNFAAFLSNWMRRAQRDAERQRREPAPGPVFAGATPRTRHNMESAREAAALIRRVYQASDGGGGELNAAV